MKKNIISLPTGESKQLQHVDSQQSWVWANTLEASL